MNKQKLFGPDGFLELQEDKKGVVTIYWATYPYYSFHKEDKFERDIAIVQLNKSGMQNKKIAKLFNLSLNTITRIMNEYEKNGLSGLLQYKQGPKNQTEPVVKNFVIARYNELKGTRGYQNKILNLVAEKNKSGEFKSTLGRSRMHEIISRHLRETASDKKKILKTGPQKEVSNEKNAVEKTEHEDIPEKEIGENEYVKTDIGGSTAILPFIAELGIMDHIPADEKQSRYSNQEMAVSYMLLNVSKVITVEQHIKHLMRQDMGAIIGKKSLPSLSFFREHIPSLTKRMNMPQVIAETAEKSNKLFSFSRTLYIDGHFIPYYGGEKTLYNYFPQRRLAHKGREHYFVHDINGNPVFFAISDNYRDMKFYIKHVDEKLRRIYGVSKKVLFEVFDRGGYSKEFCIAVNGTIRFICWRIDGGKPPEVRKWQRIKIKRQGNEYGAPKTI